MVGELPQQQQTGNVVYPSQMQDAEKAMASLVKLLYGISDLLVNIRRELRGEAAYQSANGETVWIQIAKPAFVKVNFTTNKPIKQIAKMPWGEQKEVYIPNDEAIEEVLSCMKFSGVNQITPMAGIDNDNYMDDLREFECKLAATFALKQKSWGLDKELMPLLQFKVKTVVQDARSLALDGRTLEALQRTVQRVEQIIEDRNKKQYVPGSAF